MLIVFQVYMLFSPCGILSFCDVALSDDSRRCVRQRAECYNFQIRFNLDVVLPIIGGAAG